MTMNEIWENARGRMAPNCQVCKECNGVACKGKLPGVGAAGDASSWTACMEFLKQVKLNLDTVYEAHGVDTHVSMFGRTWEYPVFVSPIGGLSGYNYNGVMPQEEYDAYLMAGTAEAGILAFVGDGPSRSQVKSGMNAAVASGSPVVPTMKPWKNEAFIKRYEEIKCDNIVALAMDIDAAGFSNLGTASDSASPKSVAEIRELVDTVDVPFILKGVMTAKGAEKAAKAGCSAIVISSHGGRVIPSAPSTCSVLPEIRAAVGDNLKIFVDGGIRSGADVFKALALGADVPMIGRPFVIAAHGGGAEGVAVYAKHIGEQLRNIMLMCGATSLEEISREMIRI
ncbi:MAG: alpha-hydroxy-acid oxidizing protein [Clostridia bacterium]|nr:alpha-hydroxy-acid oxidizing protein [Clostridia bacterium]